MDFAMITIVKYLLMIRHNAQDANRNINLEAEENALKINMMKVANSLNMAFAKDVQIVIISTNFGNASKFQLFVKIMIQIMENVYHAIQDI